MTRYLAGIPVDDPRIAPFCDVTGTPLLQIAGLELRTTEGERMAAHAPAHRVPVRF